MDSRATTTSSHRRVTISLAVTFAATWAAWWTLAWLGATGRIRPVRRR